MTDPADPGTGSTPARTGRSYPRAVDTRSEIREFLTSTRARITPEQARLRTYGGGARRATTFFVDWEKVADDAVAVLRSEAGRNPYDRDLSDLVGELSTQSEEFRAAGPSTTSAITTPGSNGCTTPSWATSSSPTRR
jgi:hypothetical protein